MALIDDYAAIRGAGGAGYTAIDNGPEQLGLLPYAHYIPGHSNPAAIGAGGLIAPGGEVAEAGLIPPGLMGAIAGLFPGGSGLVAGLLGGALGMLGGGGIDVPGVDVNLDWGTKGPGFLDVGVPGPGVLSSGIPGMRQGEKPVKMWWTGTAKFYFTNMGRVAVQKKSGVWRIYRPARHIVISRNPGVRDLLRADSRLSKLTTGLARVVTRRSHRRVVKR